MSRSPADFSFALPKSEDLAKVKSEKGCILRQGGRVRTQRNPSVRSR
jgi:hypothetical protein